MRLPIACLVALAACAQFPELDGTVTPDIANARPPELVPLSTLIARSSAGSPTVEAQVGEFTPSLTNLRNRAERLRGPVIDPATRARMLRGIR